MRVRAQRVVESNLKEETEYIRGEVSEDSTQVISMNDGNKT